MSLDDRIIAWSCSREPDRNIGPGYLQRWYLLPRSVEWRTHMTMAQRVSLL